MGYSFRRNPVAVVSMIVFLLIASCVLPGAGDRAL